MPGQRDREYRCPTRRHRRRHRGPKDRNGVTVAVFDDEQSEDAYKRTVLTVTRAAATRSADATT